jgi:hypothetical protein
LASVSTLKLDKQVALKVSLADTSGHYFGAAIEFEYGQKLPFPAKCGMPAHPICGLGHICRHKQLPLRRFEINLPTPRLPNFVLKHGYPTTLD